MATPLLVAVVALETTDLLFAIDSIPAVLSVTRDPFLVYTSNIFALMGLRALYFLLSGALRGLRFLRAGLAVMLFFTAAKMLTAEAIEVPPLVSLAVVLLILGAAIAASRLFPGKRDSSKHRHARAHFEATRHPIIRSLEPGEDWSWCYVDRMNVADRATAR